MSAKKQKYYVVWHGIRPGVYSSWAECQANIKNFPGARYKSYTSRQAAEEAFRHGPEPTEKKSSPKKAGLILPHEVIKTQSISVDAACSGNPGLMEYRGVWTGDKTEIFHFGPVHGGTNNIGEFLAIVHALAWLLKHKDSSTPVYTDSKTALAWVRRKKANTKLTPGKNNASLFDMLRRAEKWLTENSFKNPLLKWDTENWGEIPADFGRK